MERPPLGIRMEAGGIHIEGLGLMRGPIVLRESWHYWVLMKYSFCVGKQPHFFGVIPLPLHLILQADSFILTFLPADPTAPNVVVTRLTLVCDSAPGPITMDLTGKHRLCHWAQREKSKGPGMLYIERKFAFGTLQWILEEL